MKVLSIFHSIDGEVNGFGGAGELSTFVRLAFCNLRCPFCDTSRSWAPDKWVDLTLAQVLKKLRYPHLTITGGEPLLQLDEVRELANEATLQGINVSIETNGTVVPRTVLFDPRVRFIVDYKSPSSKPPVGYEDQFWWVAADLHDQDYIKFVVGDVADLKAAKRTINKLDTWDAPKPQRAYSPVWGKMDPAALVQWIQKNDKKGQLNLQLHKIVWPNVKPGEER